MYTEHIGRRLLQAWQRGTGRTLDVRTFFHEEFVPLFFDAPRQLMWVSNSPFAQKSGLTPRERAAKLGQLLSAAAAPRGPGLDASIAPGFPAAKATATTSGQVSSTGPSYSVESGYYAWLGAACGIGVSGGLSLALDDVDLLWELWRGWGLYRTILTLTPTLKGNQIETWNGQWLSHRLNAGDFGWTRPHYGLPIEKLLRPQATGGGQELPTVGWATLLLRFSAIKPTTTFYVYSLGNTNSTLGYVKVATEELATLVIWAGKPPHGPKRQEEFIDNFQPRLRFTEAIAAGRLGLAQLEPAHLQRTLAGGAAATRTPEQAAHLETCTLWLTAMLTPESQPSAIHTAGTPLAEAADQLARALVRYARHEPGRDKGRAKTKYAHLAQTVLTDSPSTFARQLSELLNASPAGPDYRHDFLAAAEQTVGLPITRFHHFQSLLRLKFQFYSAE